MSRGIFRNWKAGSITEKLPPDMCKKGCRLSCAFCTEEGSLFFYADLF